MVKREHSLKIWYSVAAVKELGRIWDCNAAKYGVQHAGAYVAYLRSEIDKLATDPTLGRVVEAEPHLRYLVMRRKQRGDGHLAIYRIKGKTVQILRIFHTKQDWPGSL